MRILLLVDKYFPSTQSCAKIMHDLALVLRDRGHEVILATADPSLATRRRVTREEGITVVRIRTRRLHGVPLPVRAVNEWRLPAAMWKGAKDFFVEHPCQLIVNYSPPIFLGRLVERLKELWGCRAYLVLRDIFPQWSVDAGVIRRGSLAHRIFRHYELALYDAADVIGVQSKRNLEYFEEHGLAQRYRLEVLHNWAADRGWEVVESRIRNDLSLESRVVFLYGGNLGVAQDAMGIVRLAASMRRDDRAFFLVVGGGSEAEGLAGAAREHGLMNIRFLPAVDHATYLGMVAVADVGLITLARDLKTHNFPGKMLDYLYFGKPILAAVNPGNDLRDVLEEHDAGLVCWNGDDRELLARARRLLESEALRHRLGRNGRSLLERVFSPSRAASQILAAASTATS